MADDSVYQKPKPAAPLAGTAEAKKPPIELPVSKVAAELSKKGSDLDLRFRRHDGEIALVAGAAFAADKLKGNADAQLKAIRSVAQA